MTPRCVRVIFDIKHCLPGPVCSSLLFLTPSKILSTHRKLRNSYLCSSYITLLSVFLSSGMQHYKGYRKSIIYFTITSMIYGLISSLSFFQHPLFLDFFQRCSINTVILKLSTIHFPSSQVLCAVNCSIKGLLQAEIRRAIKKI